jgi:hypothetical protein
MTWFFSPGSHNVTTGSPDPNCTILSPPPKKLTLTFDPQYQSHNPEISFKFWYRIIPK